MPRCSERSRQRDADQIIKGANLVNEKGCRGCHKLDGAGGVLGKALAGVGSKPIAYFPMGGVQGEKTTYAWLKQHFIDPRNLVPVSEMKVSVTDEEADQLTAYMLSLRTGEMPKQYRRFSDGAVRYRAHPTAKRCTRNTASPATGTARTACSTKS